MTNTNDKNNDLGNQFHEKYHENDFFANDLEKIAKIKENEALKVNAIVIVQMLEPVNIFKTLEYASDLFKDRNLKYGEFEYSKHLIDVLTIGFSYLNLLETEHKTNNAILNALICHDILEDCGVTYNDLKSHIGELATDIVYDVTNELGKNRKERSEKTYPKIKKNDYAIFVKCCDRLANIRFSKRSKSVPGMIIQPSLDQRNMYLKYCKEYQEFRNQLYNGKFQELWNELDKEHNAVSFGGSQNVVI